MHIDIDGKLSIATSEWGLRISQRLAQHGNPRRLVKDVSGLLAIGERLHQDVWPSLGVFHKWGYPQSSSILDWDFPL